MGARVVSESAQGWVHLHVARRENPPDRLDVLGSIARASDSTPQCLAQAQEHRTADIGARRPGGFCGAAHQLHASVQPHLRGSDRSAPAIILLVDYKITIDPCINIIIIINLLLLLITSN